MFFHFRIGYNATFSTSQIESHVVFPVNATNQTVQVNITSDGKLEDNTTVVLKLESCTIATVHYGYGGTPQIISPNVHIITIFNRDGKYAVESLFKATSVSPVLSDIYLST